MKVSYSKTREQFPLSTKKVIKKTVMKTFIWVIIFLVFGIFTLLASIPEFSDGTGSNPFISATLPIIIILFLITFITYLYQKWYFAVYFYELTPDFVQIKKGPITPKEITIPYERIQDIYVDQDILDRIFGIYDVHLSSATIASGIEAHIDGLEKKAADGLREVLLNSVKQKISRTAVPTNSSANTVQQ